MVRIRVLPDDLVNRIAAGEVVERPASVVKELVENSIDAGAARIEVELRQGGRSLVRVSDDGCGMDADDILLALERHATSKIGSAADLDRIATLGFRGEALPSIAAVSRFTLSSSADPAEGGVQVEVEGGRILGVSGAARARGTTVTVRDLFFNTPARRKFLHAPETELRHAQDTVWAAALARPEVGFAFRHSGRVLFDAPPVADAAARLADLLRGRSSGSVHRFEATAGSTALWGLLAEGRGKGRPRLTFLVNGRPVRDRLLVGAVMRVLRSSGGGFGGARVVLFLSVPPELVDVNVHPAKAEVRFARAGGIFSLVERALRQGIAASRGTVDVAKLEPLGRAMSAFSEPPEGSYGEAPAGPVSLQQPLFVHPAYDETGDATEGWAAPEGPESTARQGARSGPANTPFGRLIGQYRASFLLLEDERGLVIVDQHVAHERVLHERILRQLAGEAAPAQRLLAPILLQPGEALAAALPRVEELLLKVGVEADRFGAETVRLSALPPGLDAESAERLVVEMLERATALEGVPGRSVEELEEELAAALSCRAAIKVNHPLAAEEQRALLADLATTENPYRCPHGRPIVLRLSQEEMERRLGRR